MQCILTKSDFELFYGSNVADFIEQSSFTCPHCGKLGFSETTLCEHLSLSHASTNGSSFQEVVCPICAALPSGSGGDPNHLTEDLLQHINMEHLNNGARGLDENSAADVAAVVNSLGPASLINASNFGSTASAVAAAAALRFSRRLNYSQNTLRASGGGGSGSSARNLIGNTLAASGSGAGRYAYQFGNSGGGGSSGSGLSSFMRSTSAGLESMLSGAGSSGNGSMDPIAELLSQLTGVRRAAATSQSTNMQLQQLQAQLNREREHLQNQAASAGGSRHHHHTLGHHLFSASGSGGGSNKLNPFNSIKNMSGGQSVSAAQASSAAQAAASQTQSNLTQAMTNESLELPQNLFLQPLVNNCRDARYLLTKFVF